MDFKRDGQRKFTKFSLISTAIDTADRSQLITIQEQDNNLPRENKNNKSDKDKDNSASKDNIGLRADVRKSTILSKSDIKDKLEQKVKKNERLQSKINEFIIKFILFFILSYTNFI